LAIGVLIEVLLGRMGWTTALGVFVFSLFLISLWLFPELCRRYGLGIAFVVFAATASILKGSHAERGFYEAAAQVIPVLFLALAVEARFSIIGKTDTDTYLRLAAIYALGIGEFGSLSALATDKPGGETFAIVAGALMAVAVAVAIFAVTRGLEDQ
jgi:hypothetical protein